MVRLGLPALTILLATAVQRRFGHRLGGRFVGLPLTSGPFLLVLALADGRREAALAAHGTLVGQLGVVAFCVAYAGLARRSAPPRTALGAAVLAALAVDAAALLAAPVWLSLAAVLAGAGVALRFWPAAGEIAADVLSPRWEAPVRVVATVAVVGALTTAAPLLGGRLAGVLACLPVLLSIMTPTTHRRYGRGAAASLLRGTVASVPATAVFVAVLAVALPVGGALAWLPAVGALVVVNVLGEPRARRARHLGRVPVTARRARGADRLA